MGQDDMLRYQSYMQAVEAASARVDEEDKQSIYGKFANVPSNNPRQEQKRLMIKQILGAMRSAEDVKVKLRRLGELYFMSRESQVVLPGAVYAEVLEYLMSFTPFPGEDDVGFTREKLADDILKHTLKTARPFPGEIFEMMMSLYAQTPPSDSLFAKAHKLWGHVKDQNMVASPMMYSAYFTVCSKHNKMSEALAKYEEFKQYDLKPTPSVFVALLHGLRRAGMLKDALMIMNTFEMLPVNSILVTVCLEVLAHSDDPLSAFSCFKAITTGKKDIVPTRKMYSALLLAAARAEEGMKQNHIHFICYSMKANGVRTDNPTFLNRLLISLLKVKSNTFASDLYKSMQSRGIAVWKVAEDIMPKEEIMDKGSQDKEKRVVGVMAGVPPFGRATNPSEVMKHKAAAQGVKKEDAPAGAWGGKRSLLGDTKEGDGKGHVRRITLRKTTPSKDPPQVEDKGKVPPSAQSLFEDEDDDDSYMHTQYSADVTAERENGYDVGRLLGMPAGRMRQQGSPKPKSLGRRVRRKKGSTQSAPNESPE